MVALIIIVLIFVWAGVCYQKQNSEKAKSITTNKISDDIPQGTVDIYFNMKGTSYRSSKAIEIARSLEVDDALFLERDEGNENDPYAVKVMSHNECIGYVERKYSMAFSQCLDSLMYCLVDKVSSHDIPFIDAVAIFKSGTRIDDYVDTERVSHIAPGLSFKLVLPGDEEIEANPILKEALKLKYKEPEKALPIFLESMSKEDGLFSAHEALKCYRTMGEYEKEKELILYILDKCRKKGLDDRIATYESRLTSVDYFIQKDIRKKDLELAKSKFKEQDYSGALIIYQKYFDRSNVVISVADGLQKCYNKLGERDKEIDILQVLIAQKIADSTKDKYQRRLNKLIQP